MKKVTFEGWKNCIELKNGKFKLIVTTEVGPRVIGAFYGKSKNLFQVDPALAGKKGGDEWVNYGGHRLWHSPETKERTYEPDNGTPCTVQVVKRDDDGFDFITPASPVTGIAKTLSIVPGPEETFQVIHTIRNEGVWEIEAAAWALSVMAPGGTALVPQNQEPFALLPNSFLSIWPYTRLDDPRLTFGSHFIMVRQDEKAETPLKIGYNCKDGWLTYINDGIAFIKQFIYDEDAEYPDNGCSIEVYTNKDMLEAETLSPLEYLKPGDEITHVEMWSAFELPIKTVTTEDEALLLFGENDDCDCGCGCEDDDCDCGDDCCCGEDGHGHAHHGHDHHCTCKEEGKKPAKAKKEKAAKKQESAKSKKATAKKATAKKKK